MRLPAQDSFCRGAPPAPHLLLPLVGRHPCVPPPTYAVPSTAGHIGPALQAFRRGRCPHRPARTAPPKNCHCEPVRTLVWQSVLPPAQHHIRGTDCHVAPLLAMTFYENHSAMRRGRRLPAVVPADSRPLSWPPIGALPRNRLASSATGGASPISPTPRRHPPHFQKMSLRTGAHAGVAIRTLLRRTSCHVGKTDSHVALLLGMTISWICTALSYPP